MPPLERSPTPDRQFAVAPWRLALWMVLLVAMAVLTSACHGPNFIRRYEAKKSYERAAAYGATTDVRRPEKPSALAQIRLAQERFTNGDFAAAEREAKRAVSMDPRSADAHTVLALSLDRTGHEAAAGEHYRRAAELTPTRGGALNNYGTWLCVNGRAAESLQWFDGALASPGYETPSAAMANAGSCALKAGQVDRAGRDLRQAITLAPANPVALQAMAQLEFRAGNTLEARAFSERRLSAAPADADALSLASQIENKLGDKAAADGYVQRLRAEFPNARTSATGDGSKQ